MRRLREMRDVAGLALGAESPPGPNGVMYGWRSQVLMSPWSLGAERDEVADVLRDRAAREGP